MLAWENSFQPSDIPEVAAAELSTRQLIPMPSAFWSKKVDLPGYSKIRSASTDPIPMHGLVEALHYLLPALNATRRFEEASVPNVEETGGEFRKYDDHYFADSKQGFEDAEEILRKLDKTVWKKGEPAYALRLNQERVCLEGIDSLCKSRKDMTTKTLYNIQKTLVPLGGELGEYCSLSYHTHLLSLLTILALFKSSAEGIACDKIAKFVAKIRARDHGKDDAEILISVLHKMNRDLEDLLHKHDCLNDGKALESKSGTPYAQ